MWTAEKSGLFNKFRTTDALLALYSHTVETLKDIVGSKFLLSISVTIESAALSQFSAFCLQEYQHSLCMNSNPGFTGSALGGGIIDTSLILFGK